MAYSQGSVVVAPSKFKAGDRPYLVISNADRPFQGEEYTVATITTTARSTAVTVESGDLQAGALLRYPSFVNPWSLHVVEHHEIERRVAKLTEASLREVAETAWQFLVPDAD